MSKFKEYKTKYSILPARIIGDKRFKIAHYNVMCCFGVHAGKSGLIYCTHETIEAECPHVQKSTIKKAINDLVTWGYVHRLEPKYMRGQKSRYLTNRYMLVYEPDQDIPPYEELKKVYNTEVVASSKMDEQTKEERENVEGTASTLDPKVVREYHAMILNACSQVYGNIPNYSPREIEMYLQDIEDPPKHEGWIEVFTQLKTTQNNLPTIKEVFNVIKNR